MWATDLARAAALTAALGAALCAALCAGACGGPGIAPWEPDPGPYDRSSAEALEALPAIDAALAEARPDRVLELLGELAAAEPKNLHLRSRLQEAELLELELGGTIAQLESDLLAAGRTLDGEPRDRMRRWYALRAEQSGAPEDLVLAARIENDDLAALRLLDEALEADRDCVWGHYGRAHVLLRMGRLAEAEEALAVAIDLDPGHPRVRRLEPALLARFSEPKLARRGLLTWLEETAEDPRVSELERIDAQLELAELELRIEAWGAALGRLNSFAGRTAEQEYRRRMARSVGLEAEGRYEDSLAEARVARERRPQSFRSWVHEALLLEHHLGDEPGALVAWRRAAELAGQRSGSGVDGEAALLGLQARVAVERLTERMAQAAAAPRP